MKITIGRLREIIKKSLSGSQPDENYSQELFDDPSFQEKSVYVPGWEKKKIKSWAQDMKLSTK